MALYDQSGQFIGDQNSQGGLYSTSGNYQGPQQPQRLSFFQNAANDISQAPVLGGLLGFGQSLLQPAAQAVAQIPLAAQNIAEPNILAQPPSSINIPGFGEQQAVKTPQQAIGLGIQTASLGAGPIVGGAAYLGGGSLASGEGPKQVIGKTIAGGVGGELLQKVPPKVLGGARDLIGGAIKKINPTLQENVIKAIGIPKSTTISKIGRAIPNAVNALRSIVDNSPNIKVTDINGVEKDFNPANANFYETLQALNQTKKSIYDKYTNLATQANDQGAQITRKDFGSILDNLNRTINTRTSPFANKAEEIKADLLKLFAPKGAQTFQSISPTDFQGFLEDLNNDVKADPKSASAKIAGEVSTQIRQIMDSKISGATGEQYQALRNQYSNLKSIEQNLMNQFKRSAKKVPGLGSYLEGIGDLDVFLGALSGDARLSLRGLGYNAVQKVIARLRDPEVNLQAAFKQLQQEQGMALPRGVQTLNRIFNR